MPAAAFGDLAQVSSNKLLIETRNTHGASVRVKKLNVGHNPFDFPSRLHLLYIALDAAANLVVRHLATTPVTIGTIESEESALFLEAKAHAEDGTASPHLLSVDFQPIIFPGPAFFTVVIDEQGWEFYFPADQKEEQVISGQTHDPIVFIDKKTVILNSSPNGTSITVQNQDFAENHAFYNATKVNLLARDAVRMINFFTDENGNVFQTLADYGFEIYLRAPCAGAVGTEHRTTIIIDPDGQNQGPPRP